MKVTQNNQLRIHFLFLQLIMNKIANLIKQNHNKKHFKIYWLETYMIMNNFKKIITATATGQTAPMDERRGLRSRSRFCRGKPNQISSLASRGCQRRHDCERFWESATECAELYRDYELIARRTVETWEDRGLNKLNELPILPSNCYRYYSDTILESDFSVEGKAELEPNRFELEPKINQSYKSLIELELFVKFFN